MHDNGVRRNSKEFKELEKSLKSSRRETIQDVDYRTMQHIKDSTELALHRSRVAINSDTEDADSDNDEALQAAKHALYAKEYIRKSNKI